MMLRRLSTFTTASFLTAVLGLTFGCGAPPAVNNANVNTNVNSASPSSTMAASTTPSSTTDINTREPDQYQATVTIKAEALGGQQNVAMPTLAAKVARNGEDRRMEFAGPLGGRVVYLDKAAEKYLILPDRNEYAQLDNESTGFDIRRMMTPGEIVKQIKSMQGLQLVGDDTYNGRSVTKYRYATAANSGTPAGTVQTESFLYVDKDTGLPLHSETVTQASGNVKGYSSLRVITEMTDIVTTAPADVFAVPTSMKKIESDQVRAQVNGVFAALAAVVGQLMQQASQTAPQSSPAPSATASPAR